MLNSISTFENVQLVFLVALGVAVTVAIIMWNIRKDAALKSDYHLKQSAQDHQQRMVEGRKGKEVVNRNED